MIAYIIKCFLVGIGIGLAWIAAMKMMAAFGGPITIVICTAVCWMVVLYLIARR